MNNQGNKARYWNGVLYPENMIENWEDEISYILQIPYAYCIHDKDKNNDGTDRKTHIHIIIVFPNTTTYNHALSVLNELSKDGTSAINKVERTKNIRFSYDYLIHNTDDCKKKNKYLYDISERITGNNFDIGAYEQIGLVEKNEIFVELSEAIRKNGFTNYMDFYEFVVDTFDDMNYIEIMRTYSNHFEKLTKGNYQRWEQNQRNFVCMEYENTQKTHENNQKTTASNQKTHKKQPPATNQQPENCCPFCGSIDIKKNGKTASLSQKWACKDCGKSFVF